MTTTTTDPLVERYVAAVAAGLPVEQRTDVAEELRASILDSVEDRLDAEPSLARQETVRAVLSDLGDPTALARSYVASPRHLIGPAVFDDWWATLRAVVVVVVPLVVLAVTVAGIWADGGLVAPLLDGALTGLTVALHIGFWVTVVFWLLERNGMATGPDAESWDVDRLPELPRDRTLGVGELVGGVAMIGLALAWLPWQQFRSPFEDPSGERVPMLRPDLWQDWLWVLVALLFASLVLEVVKYAVGSWTARVTVFSVVVDLLFAGFFLTLVLTRGLTNPALYGWSDDPAAAAVTTDGVVLVATLAVCVMSAWEAVAGHRKYRTSLS